MGYYEDYFIVVAEYKEPIETNDDYNTIDYGQSINIKVRPCGPEKVIMQDTGEMSISAKTYKTDYKVKKRGLINGQIILEAKAIIGLDGDVEFYKAYV